MIQQTLIIIKPDGIIKSLTGNILTALSETKLKIAGAKIVRVSKKLAREHYKRHKGKPYYKELLKYITGGFHADRVLALVYHGGGAIAKVRVIVGDKNPEKAEPTTIRGRYGRIRSDTGIFENVIHASNTAEEAREEIRLWFKPEELTYRIFPTKKVRTNKAELVWR